MKLLNAALSGSEDSWRSSCSAWMGTWTTRSRITIRTSIRSFRSAAGRRSIVFWHEYILLSALSPRGTVHLAMLLSRHRDAEILSHVAYQLGFAWSAARPSAAAWRPCASCSARAADAPDDHARRPPRAASPHGPRPDLPGLETGAAAGGDGVRLRPPLADHAAPGTISPFRGPSPAPGPSSAPEILVPQDLDREGLEHFRRRIEAAAEPAVRRGGSLGRRPGRQKRARSDSDLPRDYAGPSAARCPAIPGSGLSLHPASSVAGKLHAS